MRVVAAILLLANVAFLIAWPEPVRLDDVSFSRPTAPEPPGVRRLVLLSERLTITEESEQLEPVLEETKPEPVPVCYAIGPLPQNEQLQAIATRLASEGYQSSVRKGDIREPAGYWVYLPAMKAREARAVVKDLKSHGIKDYFVGKQNYISLGIYSRKSQASVRQKEIAALGHDSILDKRFLTKTVHWLDIRELEAPLSESAAWDRIHEQNADLPIQKVNCE